ncbi:MAG TPA: signal peptide peptidase SppA [Candidatus Binatia bacterium]|nr:signal peptide peptidase SppA [Candidatus Binatia bacterium]
MDDNLPPPQPSPPPPPQPPPPLIMPRQLPPRRRSNGWRVVALVLLVLLIVSLVTNLRHLFGSVLTGSGALVHTAGPRLQEVAIEYNHSDNKIVVISVEGIISSDMMGGGHYTMVEYIRDQFERAKKTDAKAVILRINSPGGEVLASDEIYNTIKKFQSETKRPVIAAMSSVAASGGYYVAAPCRWIVADEMTITGSIGVILSTFNFRGLLDKVGIQPDVYKSGRYKDMLSGMRKESEIPPAERKMVQDLIDETFQKFKKIVADGREYSSTLNKSKNSPGRTLASDWQDYADGRILSGEQAYKLGFVDELGNWDVAKERALKLAGISNANFIEYQQEFSLSDIFSIFGKAEKSTVKVELGMTAPAVKPGYLYFLSPTYLH